MNRKFVLFGALLVVAQAHAAPPGDPQILAPDAAAEAWTPTVAVAPAYPADLARRGVSGCVTLSYVIENDGSVSQVQLLDGRASPRSPVAEQLALEQFAGAASAAVSTMHFTPNGEPRSTLTAATLHFGEPATSAGCEGTPLARRLEQGRGWEALISNASAGRSFASTAGENRYGHVVRAMDSPWDGSTQIILAPPSTITGGR